MDERPTFGSLFAGIGGFDLGLERAGWRGRWQVENAPYPRRVLAKHWPDVTRYGDIAEIEWQDVEPVDLVAGGFPCQPFSKAGRRRTVDDDRWLWPEFARCLRVLRPRFVLVENVRGILVGRGMGEVLGGLADLGYDAEWECISATDVGAPHLRERIFIIAWRPELDGPVADAGGGWRPDQGLRPRRYEPWPGGPDVANADGDRGRRRGAAHRQAPSWRPYEPTPRPSEDGRSQWHDDRPLDEMADPDDTRPQGHGRLDRQRVGADQSPLGPSGWPVFDWWLAEPDVGRVAHGIPHRVERLRGLGNAVVPQLVEAIGRKMLDAHYGGQSAGHTPGPGRLP